MTEYPADQLPDPDLPERNTAPILLTVRPRRIAVYAGIAATLVVAVMVVVALTLRNSNTGVYFRTADAVAMVGLGLIFGGALMLTARPRLRVSADGVGVRNIIGERFVPWPLIRRVAFPEGAVWAQLDLADDELMSVMAIQSMDRARAVAALREVRELHARFGVPVAPPAPMPQMPETDRPLGRLELIDLEKAAAGKAPKRRHRS